MHYKKLISALVICFLVAFINSATAQTTVTFNLNLKPQIQDSLFIPGQDVAEITGNIYPLGLSRPMILKDLAPKDSIYSIEISFSRTNIGKTLQYNFTLQTERGIISEDKPRVIQLLREDQDLDAIYLNAFAW